MVGVGVAVGPETMVGLGVGTSEGWELGLLETAFDGD